MRNCTKDEGRSFAVVLQEKTANRLKLLWSKVMVVSIEEKAPQRCQVWIKEMSESEPRVTCRNVMNDIKTRVASRSWDKLGGYLFTDQAVSGIHVA